MPEPDALPADPTTSGAAQSAAFRQASPEDWTGDDELAAIAVPYTGTTAPEEFDPTGPDDGWDAGRQEPKTLKQARAAAAARGDDPTLYDELAG